MKQILILSVAVWVVGCQKSSEAASPVTVDSATHEMQFSSEVDQETGVDDGGFVNWLLAVSCNKPTAAQTKSVDLGNTKLSKFMAGCNSATKDSHWCNQLTRPNPDSFDIFTCTYGAKQPHQLVHPDESTWKNAYTAVQLVQKLEAQGLSVEIIYNWWRPEPYNKNVGGAPGRHPYGTSVDVRMSTMKDMEAAFLQLCAWRKQGVIRAVGYYGSTALHFGVGDKVGNTWGKDCPK
jgi:hypothetical protein